MRTTADSLKRPVNLSINARTLELAKQMGMNISQTVDTLLADEVNTLVYDSVARFGGSISAEHGVGSLKTDKLPTYKSAVALSMMRAIKLGLDPHNIMNPGRIVRI